MSRIFTTPVEKIDTASRLLYIPQMGKRTTRYYARRITEERLAAGLSLRALAARAGVSHQTISDLESGTDSRFDVVLRLFQALGLRLEIEGDG